MKVGGWDACQALLRAAQAKGQAGLAGFGPGRMGTSKLGGSQPSP